jgi:SPP1 family predicted phage head-tail adaptor
MLTRLMHRITIQQLTTTPAGGGTFDETWTTVAERWANVQVQRANIEFSYNKIQQANYFRITMRTESFTNKNRFLFNGLVLRIDSIEDPTQDGRMMVVIAREELT